ncbi:MAG: S8 family serine peptidase [Parabacteroides sp.]|nr:S8 family serine peptidase [Parabacteroides sp.]
MKKLNLFFFLMGMLGLGFISCSDNALFSSDAYLDENSSLSVAGSPEFYYYYRGEKISIPVNTAKRYVVARKNAAKMQNLRIGSDVYAESDNAVGYVVNIGNDRTKMKSSDTAMLTRLADDPEIIAIEYVIGDSVLVPVSNLFYIKLKTPSDIGLLEQEAESIGCSIERAVASDNAWICLSSDKDAPMNSLEAANYLYETGLFEDVDPGFIFNFQVAASPSDPYFSSQWGLNGSYGIQAERAWNITKGSSSVTVAVIDQGIYTQHPDLAGKMHAYAYNCDNGTNLPAAGDHGTMCAGIVAANHNNIAIAGVAPDVKLMNISSSLNSLRANISEELANGINKAWQNGADIINNSWGDQGGAQYNNLHSALLESAIANALTRGRNGKGCVVCFASGNSRVMDYPAYCQADIMAVGAIDASGKVASFSGSGDELDVVAPGVNIVSLNVSGGVKSADGTSFASPHVAGIAALILSVAPNLTQKQVCTIVMETTRSKSWNKNAGWGTVRASRAIEVASGSYTINNQWGASAFATAKFYISDLPKSAKVQWSTAGNVATVLKNTNDTIIYRYNFSGRSMTDVIKATITFSGTVASVSYPVTVFNEPKITGVEQIFYSPEPNRIDMKVNCTDPDAQFTWSGSNDLMDFPYLGDASFMDHPNWYKSLYVNGPGTYSLTVRADNQYAYDIYTFQVTK